MTTFRRASKTIRASALALEKDPEITSSDSDASDAGVRLSRERAQEADRLSASGQLPRNRIRAPSELAISNARQWVNRRE